MRQRKHSEESKREAAGNCQKITDGIINADLLRLSAEALYSDPNQ